MNASGHRLQWPELPEALRAEIEGALGSAVVEAVGQRGGYGPSLAARCGLADGRRVFIKAVSPAQNPDTPEMMRREAHIATCLPADAPAPALLHTFDDGEWIALVFEEVAGELPRSPWIPDELDAVLDATRRLGELAPTGPLRTVAEHYGAMFTGWRLLAAEDGDTPMDPWCRAHLDELAAVEARWEQVTVATDSSTATSAATTSCSRRNAVSCSSTGRARAPAPTGSRCWRCCRRSSSKAAARPRRCSRASASTISSRRTMLPLVAALAGYFVERGRLPDPPGLPTVRAFQRAQGEVTIAWLRRLWERR